jgi:ABC-2 type transport system ATP-binding protein
LGKTVFLKTHFMDEAQHLADRVAVMRDGEIVAHGRPEDLAGRDLRPAEIRFTLPSGVGLDDLPELPCELRALDEPPGAGTGARALVLTRQPVRAAHVLTGWALERELALGHFSVEDIYLELTASGDHNAHRQEALR